MAAYQSDHVRPTIHQRPMDAIEQDGPFGEDTGPRVLRNESTVRNRVKREGRRAATRSDSHQRIYNILYFAMRSMVKLLVRMVRELYPDAAPITTTSGSTMDSSAVSHGIIVVSDALCAASEATFDAISDECEVTLQRTRTQADASPAPAPPAVPSHPHDR